jgi:GT2 family glycosyltransferase
MNAPQQDTNSNSKSLPTIICVIVNWNGWQDTVNCLTSLRRQDYDGLQVIVVDNGSTNDSVRMIREAHPWSTVIETGRNLGFPSGCNAGTRLALERGADYVWLLNNDTTVPADTARKLLATALQNPNAGAIGAVLYYMHDPTRIQAWGGGSINLWTGFVSHFKNATSFKKNTYLTGASMLLPKAICEEVGILYEGYFMYGDDSDMCLRIRRSGYELVVCEGTAILHREGASSSKRSPLIDRLATTSGLRLLKRHAPIPAISMAIYLALRFTNRVRRGEWENISAVWEGVVVYFNERTATFSESI